MPGRRWSCQEDERLMDGIEAGKSYPAIAKKLRRSLSATYQRWDLLRSRFGDTPHRNGAWFASLMGVALYRALDWLQMGLVPAKRGRRRNGAGEWEVSDDAIRVFLADWRYWPRWRVEDITEAGWRAYAREQRADVRFISPVEASRVIPYSESRIYDACRRGELPATLTPTAGRTARRWLVRVTDLERWYEGKVAA